MTGKRTLTIGLVGYEFMGKAHSNAWRQAPRFFDLPTHLRLKTICGRDAKAVRPKRCRSGENVARGEASARRQHDLSELPPHSGDCPGEANDRARRNRRAHFSFSRALRAGLDCRSKI